MARAAWVLCCWLKLGRGVLESKVFLQLGRVALQRHLSFSFLTFSLFEACTLCERWCFPSHFCFSPPMKIKYGKNENCRNNIHKKPHELNLVSWVLAKGGQSGLETPEESLGCSGERTEGTAPSIRAELPPILQQPCLRINFSGAVLGLEKN